MVTDMRCSYADFILYTAVIQCIYSGASFWNNNADNRATQSNRKK